MTEYGF
ncbi:hypothetical protein ECPA34_3744, partial [Escherichia coli PA34]